MTATSDYLNRTPRSLDEVLRARETASALPASYNDVRGTETRDTRYIDAASSPNTAARPPAGVLQRLRGWLGY